MSKVKPINWERDFQALSIHNPPESFFFQFKNIIIYANGLLEPPKVITHQVRRAETFRKVKEWLDSNKIPYKSQKVELVIKVEKHPKAGMDEKTLQWFDKYATSYKDGNYIINTYYSPGRSEIHRKQHSLGYER